MSEPYSPEPPESLPPGLAPLFTEAMAVADVSPASASALLRILVQALIKSAGRGGRNLIRDVNALAADAGGVGVLRALDVVAMSDAESRHPAELSLANGHSDVQNLVVFVHVLARSLSPPAGS